MRKRLFIVLLLLVILPIVGLIALGVFTARHERRQVATSFRNVQAARLADVAHAVARITADRERAALQVLRKLPHEADAEFYRQRVRRNRLLRQVFIRGDDGVLVYPRSDGVLTQQEREFLDRTRSVRESREAFYRSSDDARHHPTDHGWHTWFWGDGLRLILWHRTPDGTIAGAEVDRAALLADIIAELPATSVQQEMRDTNAGASLVVLRDARSKPLYQWGLWEPEAGAEPLARHALRAPLSAWHLEYYGPTPSPLTLRGSALSIALGVAAVIMALIGLAIYFYRESDRDIREASQRVSFVNQVSHELKTPLTNIRMYAELLEREIPEDAPRATRYLKILNSESARLSRLILNVLTFARQNRDTQQIRRTPGDIMDVVRESVAGHELALSAAGLAIELRGEKIEGSFDPDALKQILGNLISNAEKYATDGDRICIDVRRDADQVRLVFSDNGGGIPKARREHVFEPFVRLSNRLADGVSGTGIGLTISRHLAREHGGDLVLTDSESGTAFVLTLNIDNATEQQS